MNTHAEKTQENQSASNEQKVDLRESTDQQHADSSPEMQNQQKRLDLISHAPQTRQFKNLQRILHAQQNTLQSTHSILLKKDPALWSAGDKIDGYTSTKVIKTKQGSTGLFRYPMQTNIIDSFIGKNVADEKIVRPKEYQGVQKIDIPVAVAEHDLSKKYKDDAPGLDANTIQKGTRPTHFAHADKSHGIDRTDQYTWHHKNALGKMELIDMNVHGAMWHYGGIAGWAASLHTQDSEDDPTP